MRPKISFPALAAGVLLAASLTAVANASETDGEPPDHVTIDDDTGRVEFFDLDGYLTGPSRSTAESTVLDYVRQSREVFGLDERDAETITVKSSLQRDAVTYVTLAQVVDGRPVHHGTLAGAVDSAGRLVTVNGQVWPSRTSGSAELTAGEAIGIAADRGGARTREAPPGSATRALGKHSYPNPYARGLSEPTPVSAEQVWVWTGDRLRLAWRTDVEVSPDSWHESLIDATTGAVLGHTSRYAHSGPEGTVFTGQHPDDSPPRTTVPLSGLDGSWVGSFFTSGNNVNAYLDRDNTNANDEYPPVAIDQHFNYLFTDAWRNLALVDDTDFTNLPNATWQAALDADLDAIITQLFYYTNDMHDWLYGYGFDEVSGNFQVDNFGRGGQGGDPVLAHAQDGFNFGCTQDPADPNLPGCRSGV